MPGPSFAPFLAAIGAFLLFLGLVFGGPLLVIGAIALILTLLYWLGEALRIYDREVGDAPPALPPQVHDGPPPGVHVPGPSFRPFLGALGAAFVMLGLVFGGWLLAVGIVALVLTLVGWLIDARKEYVQTVRADTTGHLENIPAPRAPTALLASLAVLLVVGIVLQAGWLPPSSASEGEGAAAVRRAARQRWTAAIRRARRVRPARGARRIGCAAAGGGHHASSPRGSRSTRAASADPPMRRSRSASTTRTRRPHNVAFKDAGWHAGLDR